jgi:hypothetical protein
MESLGFVEKGLDENRANIQAGMTAGMAHGLFDDLWELYVKVHAEHALPDGEQ